MSGEVIKSALDQLDSDKLSVSDKDKKALESLLNSDKGEVNAMMINAIKKQHPGLLEHLKNHKDNILNTLKDFLATNPNMNNADKMGIAYLIAVTQEGDYQKVDRDSLGGKQWGSEGYLQTQQAYLNGKIQWLTDTYQKQATASNTQTQGNQNNEGLESFTGDNTNNTKKSLSKEIKNTIGDGNEDVADIKELDKELDEKINKETNKTGNQLLEEIFDELKGTETKPDELQKHLKKAVSELKNFKGDVKNITEAKIKGLVESKKVTDAELTSLAKLVTENEAKIMLVNMQNKKENNNTPPEKTENNLDGLKTPKELMDAGERLWKAGEQIQAAAAFERASNLGSAEASLRMASMLDGGSDRRQLQRDAKKYNTGLKTDLQDMKDGDMYEGAGNRFGGVAYYKRAYLQFRDSIASNPQYQQMSEEALAKVEPYREIVKQLKQHNEYEAIKVVADNSDPTTKDLSSGKTKADYLGAQNYFGNYANNNLNVITNGNTTGNTNINTGTNTSNTNTDKKETLSTNPTQLYQPRTYSSQLSDVIGDRDANHKRQRLKAFDKILNDKEQDVDGMNKNIIRYFNRLSNILGKDFFINIEGQKLDRMSAVAQILEKFSTTPGTDVLINMSKNDVKVLIDNTYPELANRFSRKVSEFISLLGVKDIQNIILIQKSTKNAIATGNSVEQNRIIEKEYRLFDANKDNTDLQKSFLNSTLLSVCDFDANGTVDSKYIGTAVSESQLYELFLHAKPRPNYEEKDGQFSIVPGPETSRLLSKILTTASIVSSSATPQFKADMAEYASKIKAASNNNAESIRLFSEAVIKNPIIRDAFKTTGEGKLEAHFTKDSAKAGDATLMDDINLADRIKKMPYQQVFGPEQAAAFQEKYLSKSIDLSNLPAGIDKARVMKSAAYDIMGVMNTVTDMIYLKTQGLDPAKAGRVIDGIFKTTHEGQAGISGTLSVPLDKDGNIARNNPVIKNKIGEYVRNKLQIKPAVSVSQDGAVNVGLGIGTEHIADDFSNRFERGAGAGLNLKDLTAGGGLKIERTRQTNSSNKEVTSTLNNAAVNRLGLGFGVSLPNPDIQIGPVREKDVLGGLEQRKQTINKLYGETIDKISLTADMIKDAPSLRAAIIASAGPQYDKNKSLFDAIADMSVNALEADQFFGTTEGVTSEQKIAYAKAVIVGTAKDRAAFLESNAVKDLNGEVKITKLKGTISATDALLAAGVAIPGLNVISGTALGIKKTIQLVGSVRLSAFKAEYTADKGQLAYIDKQLQDGNETRGYQAELSLDQHAQNIKESLMVPGLEVKTTADGMIQLSGAGLASLRILAKKTDAGKQYAYDGKTLTLGKIGEYQAATTLGDKGKTSTLILGGKGLADTEPVSTKTLDGVTGVEFVEKFKALDQAKYIEMVNKLTDNDAKLFLSNVTIGTDGKMTVSNNATGLDSLKGQKLEPGAKISIIKDVDGTKAMLVQGNSSSNDNVSINYIDKTKPGADESLVISPEKLEFGEEFAEAEALLSQINPHELYHATIRNPVAYKAFLSSNMSGGVDSADLIKPLLNNIIGAEDKADATKLATYIGSADDKTKEYISIRFKQLSAMSKVTQDKSDVTPAQKTELATATTALPSSLSTEKTPIQALIDRDSNQAGYTTDFLKIDRHKVVKEGGAEGKKLLFALRPINETMEMRGKTTGYDTLKKKYQNNWNEVSGFGEAAKSIPDNAKQAILKARSDYMNQSDIVNKPSWTKKVEKNLVGVSAFYRGTNAHKEMGMTIPGAVATVDGKLVDIAADKQSDVKKWFVDTHLNNNPNIKAMYLAGVAKNISEQVKSKVASASDITPEQAEQLINGGEVKVGDITISGLKTNMVFYAMGECANESVGMQLGEFKLKKPGGKEENVSATPDKEKYHKLAGSEILNATDMDIRAKERQISVTGVTEVDAGGDTPTNMYEREGSSVGHGNTNTNFNTPGAGGGGNSGVGPNTGGPSQGGGSG